MHYPGLPSHPQHKLAVKQMTGYSGMIAVEIKGGVGGGKAFVEVCLFDLILYVPSTIFQLNRDGSSCVKSVLS